MTLAELGERKLIDRIRRRGLVRPAGVVRGIGDDAAVFHIGEGRVAVVTTDLLLEGVHFRLERGDPRRLGAKSLLVNLSDLAAMGARPREAFLGLAAPGSLDAAVADALLAGFEEVARRHEVNLLGGDTCASLRDLVIAVTVVGDAIEQHLAWRSGAGPGDVLYVTGTLGDSALGLLLLERGGEIQGRDRQALVDAHELPRAYVAEGAWLAASGGVSAMIDLSDGLAADLPHILGESGGLGARIEATGLPLSPALRALSGEIGADPLALALEGGEDYRLLVSVKAEAAFALEAGYRERFGEPLHRVGRIEPDPGVRLARDGRVEALGVRGYRHWSA